MEFGSSYKARERKENATTGFFKETGGRGRKTVEMDMENKEATPVEDVERLLPPVLFKQPAQPEEQPEMHTQTGEVNLQEKSKTMEDRRMEKIMEIFMKMDENRKEDSQSLSKKMEDCLLYTSRCV